MTDLAKLSLHRKLSQVMWEAERIPKNGIGPREQGSYPFVQVGDAADFIRKALAEKVVSMVPSKVEVLDKTEHTTAKGGSMTTVDLKVTWTLTDGESGETATIESFGAGADTGDKYSGKAMTSAMKYAMLAGFLLSTGDDAELTDTSDRRPKQDGGLVNPPRVEDANGDETLELLGNLQKTGKAMKGGADKYQGDWWQQPEGHAIGFRLKLDGDDRDIPQVLINGVIGEGLFLVSGDKPLVGQQVTVKGKLYNVRPQGRRSYYRLIVGEHPDSDFIETADARIPGLDAPVEAESLPAFAPDELSDVVA